MSNADEKLVDEYLSGGTPYSARYRRVQSDAIPSDIDRAVLDAAARVHRSKWRTWGPTLALAATAVLTVSIVLRTNVESLAPTVPQESERIPEEKMKAPTSPAVNLPKVVSQKTPSNEPVRKEKEIRVANVESRKDQSVRESKSEKQVERDAARVEAKPVESSRPAASSSAASQAESGATSKLAQVTASQSIAAAPMEMREDRLQSAKKDAQESETSVSGFVPPPAPTSAAMRARAQADPSQWLERIRQLRNAGKNIEADDQWKKFVAAFPDYTVATNDIARPKKN